MILQYAIERGFLNFVKNAVMKNLFAIINKEIDLVSFDLEWVVYDLDISSINPIFLKIKHKLDTLWILTCISTWASFEEIDCIHEITWLYDIFPRSLIFSCVELWYNKNDKRFFQHVLLSMNSFLPVHIDDSPNGIIGANAIGFITFYLWDSPDFFATYTIKNLTEFYNLIS